MEPAATEAARYDPLEPGQAADPYPRYAELREHAPVSESLPGFVFLARHGDAAAALRDASTYSSALGMRIHGQVLDPQDIAINEMDTPRHTRIRRVLIGAFSPAAVAALEPDVVALTRAMVDAIAPRGEVDLVETVTVPIPTNVVATLIGVPPEDRHDFKRWSDDIMINGVYGRDTIATLPEFHAYLDAQIAARHEMGDAAPDDVITKFLRTEIDGEHLTDREVRTQVRFLVMAGNETTTNLLGNTLYEVLRRPGLWSRLRGDRSLVPVVVEETLRYNAPVQFLPRTCATDTEIAGTVVASGQRVLIGLGSANRDEAVFPDGEEFRLDRGTEVPHLTFGLGPHFCLGASLARMEARVVLDALLDRFADLELVPGFEYEKAPMMMVRGPRRLDVRLTPAPQHP